MKNLVIFGAGELGKEVVWLVEDINRTMPTWLILGFLDDTKEKGEICHGYPVLGTMNDLEDLNRRTSVYAVIALQKGEDRKRIADMYPRYLNWASIIHPTAVVAPDTSVGRGCVIFPQAIVSVGSRLGDHDLLYMHATIANDCSFDDCVSVMTGVTVSEHVTIGQESYIAAGSNIYPRISIGNGAKIAVGTTVENDVPDGEVFGKKGKGILFK